MMVMMATMELQLFDSLIKLECISSCRPKGELAMDFTTFKKSLDSDVKHGKLTKIEASRLLQLRIIYEENQIMYNGMHKTLREPK